MIHANEVSAITQTFPKRLTEWRKKIGWLQKEAADHFGVTLNGYQKWESGERTPSKLAMCEIERRMESAK